MQIEYKDGTIINYFIMTQILDWCYTSTLDFSSLKIQDVMIVLKAAQELDITHLRYICDQYIKSELTVDSSFIVLKQATLLNMEDIKTLAKQFAFSKWSQFTLHKKGMEIIGIELFQEITIAMTQNQNQNRRLSSLPNSVVVKDSLKSDFESIYKEGRFVDAEFVVTPPKRDDGTQADITTFQFHKAMIACYSKPLFHLISSQPKAKQFVLDGLFGAAISDLLQFIYFGKKNLDPIGALQIVEHAMSQYSLHAIRDAASFSIANGIDKYNAISILRLTYLPQCKHRSMVKLRQSVLDFICVHFQEIDIPSLRNLEHSHFDHNLMSDVLEAFYFFQNPSAQYTVAKPSLLAPNKILAGDIASPRNPNTMNKKNNSSRKKT